MARVSNTTAYSRGRITPNPTKAQEASRRRGIASTGRRGLKKGTSNGKAKRQQKKLVPRVTVEHYSRISPFRYNVEAILRHGPNEVKYAWLFDTADETNTDTGW
jgi:hypothetical protein